MKKEGSDSERAKTYKLIKGSAIEQFLKKCAK